MNYEKYIPRLEMPGIEPGAFHMQSERATTALHPLVNIYFDYSNFLNFVDIEKNENIQKFILYQTKMEKNSFTYST